MPVLVPVLGLGYGLGYIYTTPQSLHGCEISRAHMPSFINLAFVFKPVPVLVWVQVLGLG